MRAATSRSASVPPRACQRRHWPPSSSVASFAPSGENRTRRTAAVSVQPVDGSAGRNIPELGVSKGRPVSRMHHAAHYRELFPVRRERDVRSGAGHDEGLSLPDFSSPSGRCGGDVPERHFPNGGRLALDEPDHTGGDRQHFAVGGEGQAADSDGGKLRKELAGGGIPEHAKVLIARRDEAASRRNGHRCCERFVNRVAVQDGLLPAGAPVPEARRAIAGGRRPQSLRPA